jgi:hypothetical protein
MGAVGVESFQHMFPEPKRQCLPDYRYILVDQGDTLRIRAKADKVASTMLTATRGVSVVRIVDQVAG